MAIAFDNGALGQQQGGAGVNCDTASWTISGSEVVLLAFLGSGASSPSDPSSSVWGTSGGDSLTKDGTTITQSFIKLSRYQKVGPTIASRVLRGTWPATDDEQITAGVSYTGVDQTTTFRTAPTPTKAASNSPSLTFTTQAGDMCVACLWVLDIGGSGPDITATGGGQTNRLISKNGTFFASETVSVDEKVASGASTTISYTLDASYDWIMMGFILIPSAGAGGGTPYNIENLARRNRPGRGPYSLGNYFRYRPDVITFTPTQNFAYSATGGITLSGTAAELRKVAKSGAGGLVFGGAASVSFVGTQSFSYTASGGMTLSGTSAEARVAARTTSGGLNFGGAATVSTHESTRTVTAAGGLQLGGAAGYSNFTVGGGGHGQNSLSISIRIGI